MYGLVNIALRDMLCERHEGAMWRLICTEAKLTDDAFLAHESYPDSTTYAIVQAAGTVLGIPVSELLQDLGRFWMLRTAKENYGAILDACGDTLEEFLHNLPEIHTRVMLVFPKLRPPLLEFTETGNHTGLLRYTSTRDGLAPLVIGMLEGAAERVHSVVTIELIEPRQPGSHCDVFRVSW